MDSIPVTFKMPLWSSASSLYFPASSESWLSCGSSWEALSVELGFWDASALATICALYSSVPGLGALASWGLLCGSIGWCKLSFRKFCYLRHSLLYHFHLSGLFSFLLDGLGIFE